MLHAARSVRLASFLVLSAAAFAGTASAQVVLSGNVSDGAGGPLLSGVVYHATGAITVPAGLTLTAQPGAIVKYGTGGFLDVHGVLDVNGTAMNPVVFTSLPDDSAGGDTNGDGPSVGSPVQWPGVRFFSTSDASVAEHLVVRFGGIFGWALVTLNQSDVTLTDCTFERGGFAGLDLANGSFPTVSGCAFSNNGGTAVIQVAFGALPGFHAVTASGNAGGDYQNVQVCTLGASATIGTDNLLNGVMVLSQNGDVLLGATLTLGPGVIVKLKPAAIVFDVHGTLVTQGTALAPVVVTSFADDSIGGDTNADGPSTGSPLQWGGMRFFADSDASVLDRLVVRNGGNSGLAAIALNQSDATLRDCIVERSGNAGLDLMNASLPSVQRCVFRDNALVAVRNVPIHGVPGFVRCTASGNGDGNHLGISAVSASGNAVMGLSNLINGVLVLDSHLTIPVGASVTLLPGVVVKPRYNHLIIDAYGALLARGAGARPVVFTSFKDDQFAGDTNGDGPSVGAGLDWYGIRINPGSASVIEYSLVRFGGNGGFPNLQCHSAQATLRSVRVERSGFTGFYISAHAPEPMFNLVAFANAGAGILLGGGSQELAHATSVGNGGAGLWDLGPYVGLVTGCISWGNLGGNFFNFVSPTGAQVVASNGDPILAGSYGNLFQIPAFVDEAGGDLHLTTGSAMLDHADLAYASVAVKDHEENSRLLDDDINSVALPDMGAYELAHWRMTVTGEPQLGETLTFTVQSLPGLSFYLVGFLDGVLYTQPHGFITAGKTTLIVVPTPIPVGTPVIATVPVMPTLVGLAFGVQTATVPIGTTAWGNITNLYRGVVQP